MNKPETEELKNSPSPVENRIKKSPGNYLKSARESMGLSIEEVADQIKLAPRQIIALEEDNYASLPGGLAVIRGFVRSYAKSVKLDPQPLIGMISLQPTNVLKNDVSNPSIKLEGAQTNLFSAKEDKLKLYVYSVLACIVVLLISFLGFQLKQITNTPDRESAPETQVIDLSPALILDNKTNVNVPTGAVNAENSAAATSALPAQKNTPAPNLIAPTRTPVTTVPSSISTTGEAR